MSQQNEIIKYFTYEHLPENLKVVSKPFFDLAMKFDYELCHCQEKNIGLRKLLEAKDCFVRAALEK